MRKVIADARFSDLPWKTSEGFVNSGGVFSLLRGSTTFTARMVTGEPGVYLLTMRAASNEEPETLVALSFAELVYRMSCQGSLLSEWISE